MKGSVFLTGGSGGLGLSVVKELLAQDWHIVALVHSDSSEKRLKDTFPNEPLKVVRGSVTNEEDIKAAMNGVNRINALIHLAGGFIGAKNMDNSSVSDFQSIMNLNTVSGFLLLRNILPLFKQQKGGSVVMIGAKPALYPNGQNAAYAASKAALTNLVLSAAEEGRSANIRANVVMPAVIDTPDNRKWANDNTPTEKWTSAKDIATTIAWLISDQGKSVTGTVIPMFNGFKTF